MLNIKARFGKRYRVNVEEGGTAADPWSMQVACRYGFIYLHGGKTLGAATTGRRIAQRLARLPGVTIWQDGDDGANVLFDVSHFDAVGAIMRPRSRRRLSAEHKAKFIAASVPFRPVSGVTSDGQNCVAAGGCDSEAA